MEQVAHLAAISLLVVGFIGGFVRGLDNGLGRTPPLGWSTWCADGPCTEDRCTEREVLATMEAMAGNGLQAAGYHWMILDDCWAAGNRTASGELTWDPSRFPHGIPYLAQKLHEKGFKLGVYTSAGNTTCDSGGRPYSIPGSEGHYQQDMDTFAAWNVDYVKIDWCGDVHNLPLDGIAVGAKDYKALSAAANRTGKALYLEGVAAYIFLLWEVGDYYNTWRACTDHHDNWHNTLGVIESAYGLDFGSPGPGQWAYMDVLMTGGQGCPTRVQDHCPGMTDTEYRTEFTMWSLMQSPLVVSTNVRNMTKIMNDTLFNPHLLGIHQDTRTPPGRAYGFPESCGGKWGNLECSLYARPLHDGSALVVMLNAGSEAQDISFPLAKLWSNASAASGIDVWSGSNVTSSGGSFTAYVESHGVAAALLFPS